MPRQPELPHMPPDPKKPPRKVIQAIEDLCLKRDKKCGSRTKANDEIVELDDDIQAALVEHKLAVYTYEDDNGVLQDVVRVEKLRKKKSAANPKPKKKAEA